MYHISLQLELLCTLLVARPYIVFAVNLLARFSSTPTKRHWNGVKHVLRYLQGTIDLGLFYPNNTKPILIGYADASYLSDPHKRRSQTGYVLTCGGTTIYWRSQKQAFVATSLNHAEIIALYEASRECVWLRSMTQHIRATSGLSTIEDPITFYEDNAACVDEGRIHQERHNKVHSSEVLFIHSRAREEQCYQHPVYSFL